MAEQEVTKTLARWAVDCTPADMPEEVRAEGVRTFVNWLGCAVGGAREPTVDRALAGVRRFAGPEQATVLGRGERLDVLHAALLNGISSHVLDYDDTHLKTIIHPAGPVASAVLAVAELQRVSGQELQAAVTVGVEVACRIGNSVYPEHYDRGWHITGTTGVFGAAAAVGRLLGLDHQRMTWAFGIAATQASGFREMFGTMCKSFHPGRAAQGGALAAFLAEAGFDSSERAIEAPRGFAHVLSTKFDPEEILGGLGERWEAALNSYKPFACGIVIHPTIDGCIQLRDELGEKVKEIKEVRLRAHPLVLELTGKREPKTGLEGKFSVFHSAAAALLRGDGSPTAFTDELVNAPDLVELRRRVEVTTDPAVHEDAVDITVTLNDGRRIERRVEHAIGSLDRPLSNQELDHKFKGQAAPVLGDAATERLLELAWRLPELDDAAEIARAAVPAAR
ncbi:MAG TPA: MmgE/PrpD family protein [Geminicoccaceae bacterium]|nr:MmgE/PrpD family protein [Geminicoccaceae bacterium]